MNMQKIAEQMRQESLKSANDNYSAQLAAIEAMRKATETAHYTHIAEINARFGVTGQVPEISEESPTV